MKTIAAIFLLAIIIGISTAAGAALVDRGGGLIYDSVLNVTWLQDANYAKTSGYDADGKMTWSEATAWTASLSYYDPVRSVTWTGWRLPQTMPISGTSYNYSAANNGSTDMGYNISAPGSVFVGGTGSEMAYMYYNPLSNKAYVDLNGHYPQPGWVCQPNAAFVDGTGNAVSFQNLQGDFYWSSTTYAPNANRAWVFNFSTGHQTDDPKANFEYYAWAVRQGDVAALVPDPPSILMLLPSLGSLAVLRRRFKK